MRRNKLKCANLLKVHNSNKKVTENGNQGDFSQKNFCSLVAKTEKNTFSIFWLADTECNASVNRQTV
jgi:hypothetical protein